MRESYDPLTFIPSSSAIRKHLAHAKGLVKRLRILLHVAKRIEATKDQPEAAEPDAIRRGDEDCSQKTQSVI